MCRETIYKTHTKNYRITAKRSRRMDYQIVRITKQDLEQMHALLDCFGQVFDQLAIYGQQRPSGEYLASLLGSESFIALAAIADGQLLGGLVAYELKKFEQQRSEIYIYDLAVYTPYRRAGIASALIDHLRPIAKQLGAWVIFVQADYVDEPAVKLYEKLGEREEVLHFDIPLVKHSD